MSRWREPKEKSSPYITPEGYEKLERETGELWHRRAEVTRALSAAAAEGDRSENAEYIYRKKELRGIDSRISYLQRRMPTLNVVSIVEDESRVYFGSSLSLEDESGEQHLYRIVGADELDEDPGKISVDSPLARALLGKSVDDEVVISVGSGQRFFTIVQIKYD